MNTVLTQPVHTMETQIFNWNELMCTIPRHLVKQKTKKKIINNKLIGEEN
jgi:hypothetical protein